MALSQNDRLIRIATSLGDDTFEKHTNAANFNRKVSGTYTLRVNGNIIFDAGGLVIIRGAKVIMNG